MREKQKRILLHEATLWQQEGLIDATTLAQITARYPIREEVLAWRSIILLSIGALLTGLGIIALLGANWDNLQRPLRALIAFSPLGLCVGLWVLAWVKRWEARALMEPLGIFWVLAVGSCLSLISQTYQISGSADNFTLTWSILMLPVLYATWALMPMLTFFVGLFVWVCLCASNGTNSQAYWLLAPLAVPALVALKQQAPEGLRFKLGVWGAALISVMALGFTLEKALPGIWMIVYSGLFSALLAGGRLLDPDREDTIWQNPMRTIGAVGLAVVLFLLTFKWCWQEVGYSHWAKWRYEEGWQLIFDFSAAVLLPLAALGLTIWHSLKCTPISACRLTVLTNLLWGLAPLLVALLYILEDTEGRNVQLRSLVVTGHLVVAALVTLAQGLMQRSLLLVNASVSILLAVIAGKFLSDEYSFTVRGLVFLGCGMLFFVVNWIAARKLRRRS